MPQGQIGTAIVPNAPLYISCLIPKIQQTKMLVTCQRYGELFSFGLIWSYSSNHKTYNKGSTMEDDNSFWLLAKNLKNEVLKRDPIKIL